MAEKFSPWGKIPQENIKETVKGITLVSNDTGGGMMIVGSVAKEHFSKELQSRGIFYKGNHCFDQDYGIAIPLIEILGNNPYELDDYKKNLAKILFVDLVGIDNNYVNSNKFYEYHDHLIDILSFYDPIYLKERKIGCNSNYYKFYEINKRYKELLEMKHSDLIIKVIPTKDKEKLKVITADGKEHLVLEKSYKDYDTITGINLLSFCHKCE